MIPYRCYRCGTRVAKARMPLEYAREPRCKGCGHELHLDTYRLAGRDPTRQPCTCPAAHYPHREGWCQALARRWADESA